MKNVYLSDEIKGWLLQSDSGILILPRPLNGEKKQGSWKWR